ncbi:hypothetical protein BGX38DRAFT_1318112 [Terfezia claveryi]|nr:hypothetical protein BGX38DRAFT_1318112 [Terfezia claveryi]
MSKGESHEEELVEENWNFEHGKNLNANDQKYTNAGNNTSMYTRCIPKAKRRPDRNFNVSEKAGSSRDVPEKVQVEDIESDEAEFEFKEAADQGDDLDDYEEMVMMENKDKKDWEEEEGVQEDITYQSELKRFRRKENETGQVALTLDPHLGN